MAIGTPVALGLTQSTGVTQLILTTSATADAGNLLLVFPVGNTTTTAVATIVDDAGNGYPIIVKDGATQTCSYGFTPNALVLNSGQTITATFSGVSASHALGALSVPGVALIPDPRDTAIGVISGTSTSTTALTTPVLKQPDNIVFCQVAFNGSISGFTPAAGWTSIIPEDVNIGPYRICYQITTTNAPLTFTCSWTTSRAWRVRMVIYKGISPETPSLSTLGVGF